MLLREDGTGKLALQGTVHHSASAGHFFFFFLVVGRDSILFYFLIQKTEALNFIGDVFWEKQYTSLRSPLFCKYLKVYKNTLFKHGCNRIILNNIIFFKLSIQI